MALLSYKKIGKDIELEKVETFDNSKNIYCIFTTYKAFCLEQKPLLQKRCSFCSESV